MTPLDPIWGEVRGRLVPGWDRGDRCRPWPPGADAEDGLRSGRGNNKSFCPGRRRRLRERRKCRMTSPDLGHLSRRSSRRRGYRSTSPPLKSREATPLSTLPAWLFPLSAADTTRRIAVGAVSVALKETRDAIVELSVPPQLDLEFCRGAARFFSSRAYRHFPARRVP